MTGVAIAGDSFEKLCSTPDVIKCIGFDSDSEVSNGNEYTRSINITRMDSADGGIEVYDPDESHSPLNGIRDSRIAIDMTMKMVGIAQHVFGHRESHGAAN